MMRKLCVYIVVSAAKVLFSQPTTSLPSTPIFKFPLYMMLNDDDDNDDDDDEGGGDDDGGGGGDDDDDERTFRSNKSEHSNRNEDTNNTTKNQNNYKNGYNNMNIKSEKYNNSIKNINNHNKNNNYNNHNNNNYNNNNHNNNNKIKKERIYMLTAEKHQQILIDVQKFKKSIESRDENDVGDDDNVTTDYKCNYYLYLTEIKKNKSDERTDKSSDTNGADGNVYNDSTVFKTVNNGNTNENTSSKSDYNNQDRQRLDRINKKINITFFGDNNYHSMINNNINNKNNEKYINSKSNYGYNEINYKKHIKNIETKQRTRNKEIKINLCSLKYRHQRIYTSQHHVVRMRVEKVNNDRKKHYTNKKNKNDMHNNKNNNNNIKNNSNTNIENIVLNRLLIYIRGEGSLYHFSSACYSYQWKKIIISFILYPTTLCLVEGCAEMRVSGAYWSERSGHGS